MFFKLKEGVGNHTETGEDGKPITYIASEGTIIETDSNLCKKFPNKFKRVNPTNKSDNDDFDDEDVADDEVKKKPAKKKAAKKIEDKEPLGKDVTPRFPRAEEEDLNVFYVRGKGYFVAEADDPFIALNKEAKKKADVEKFIIKFLKG